MEMAVVVVVVVTGLRAFVIVTVILVPTVVVPERSTLIALLLSTAQLAPDSPHEHVADAKLTSAGMAITK